MDPNTALVIQWAFGSLVAVVLILAAAKVFSEALHARRPLGAQGELETPTGHKVRVTALTGPHETPQLTSSRSSGAG